MEVAVAPELVLPEDHARDLTGRLLSAKPTISRERQGADAQFGPQANAFRNLEI
jgi:hypothetical protein